MVKKINVYHSFINWALNISVHRSAGSGSWVSSDQEGVWSGRIVSSWLVIFLLLCGQPMKNPPGYSGSGSWGSWDQFWPKVLYLIRRKPPYDIAYRKADGLSTCGLFKTSLCRLLCGQGRGHGGPRTRKASGAGVPSLTSAGHTAAMHCWPHKNIKTMQHISWPPNHNE